MTLFDRFHATRGATEDFNGNNYGIWGRLTSNGKMVHVANTYDTPHLTPEQQHATATLLATAPQMLEALHALVKQADMKYPHFEKGEGRDVLALAKLALINAQNGEQKDE